MLLEILKQRRVLFFGGKGGVGKTTLASATATGLAHSGKHVLVVSTDPAHNLGHLWQRELGSEPVRLTAGLDGIELDPASTVNEHLQSVEKSLRKLMPERLNGEIKRHLNQAREAPGMIEAALLERIAVTIEDGLAQYDTIIFDTAPTGHTTRLLELPELMAAWTEGLLKNRERAGGFTRALSQFKAVDADDNMGNHVLKDEPSRDHEMRAVLMRRQDRFRALREILTDDTRTAFIIVLTAERLPVLETIELCQRLNNLRVPIGGLVVNRRSPRGESVLLDRRAQNEDEHLSRLTIALSHNPPEIKHIPLNADEIIGEHALLNFFLNYIQQHST